MGVSLPGGTTETGVADQTGATGSVPFESKDGPSVSQTAGKSLRRQVVHVHSMAEILDTLHAIDDKLGVLCEALAGFKP